MKAFIGGVSGVGKTTFVALARLRGVQAAQSSDLLFDAFRLRRGDYRSLKAIGVDEKDRAFERIVGELLDAADLQQRHILVEGHYLNFNDGTARCVVGPWIRRFDVFVLLEAQSEEIKRRAQADGTRTDRYSSCVEGAACLEEIAQALIITRKEALRLSQEYGRPLLILDNGGESEVTLEQFLRAACISDAGL